VTANLRRLPNAVLPADVVEWLESSPLYRGENEHAKNNREQLAKHLHDLGIDPSSQLAEFYLNYDPCCVRGWYQLNRVESIAAATAFVREFSGVDYLALTGAEGGGMTLYHLPTGQVFDVEFGQFEALQANALPPIANSFVDYLRWCKAKDEEDV